MLSVYVLIAYLLCSAYGWIEFSKDCPAGCEARGNCNHELGVCECPFGWKGPACETPLFSACRTSGSPKSVLMLHGPIVPKACECYLQMRKHFCNNPPRNREGCYQYTPEHWGSVKCYMRDGVPADQQFTDFPGSEEDGKVSWYKAPGPHPLDLTKLDKRPEWKFAGQFLIPLKYCQDRCNERGYCLARNQDAKQGSCFCFKSFGGAACEESQPRMCLNQCSGRGQCIGGFCKCEKGWWGMDCSRSKAYFPAPDNMREHKDLAYARTELRIYRYELPWDIAFPEITQEDRGWKYDELYGAFELFYDQFSRDTVTRTENPWEANLFFVPGLIYYYTHNAGDPMKYVARVMHYIKETYPTFWHRNNGKDHFVWIPGDIGACWLKGGPFQQNPIKIVHFALQVRQVNYTIMPLRDHVKRMTNYAHAYSCFKKEKDVVTPPHLYGELAIIKEADDVYKEALQLNHTRPYTLYFGGGIRYWQPEYSGGARQAWHTYYIQNATEKWPDIKYGGSNLVDGKQGDFCFIPYGDGWGSRIMFAMQHACIPVVIQDYVHQPFDDIIPWETFSIRMRVADIKDMMYVLRRVSPQRKLEYRQAMDKYRSAFHWHADLGGQAYNYTIKNLHHKLYYLWGHHYKRAS